jgi:V/A-type H+-transporting ATPase subunit I
MAFEAFHKIQFVVSNSHAIKFRDYLHRKGIIHLKDISNLSSPSLIHQDKASVEELDQKIQAVEYLLDFIEEENPTQSSFLENFIPNRPVLTFKEVKDIDNSLDPIPLYKKVLEQQEIFKDINEKYCQIIPEMALFHVLKDFYFDFSRINTFRHLSFLFYKSNGISIEELLDHPFIEENALLFDFRDVSPTTNFHVVVCNKKVEQEMDALLIKFGLHSIDYSIYEGLSRDIYQRFLRDFKMYSVQLRRRKEELDDLINHKENLTVLKDLLTNQKDRNAKNEHFAQTKHISFIEGFIPDSLVNTFIESCNTDYPEVFVEVFPTDEPAPVKFKNNNFFKPFEFIIRMFGIPRYGMIDPTPFITITFLILFGLAFGDVIYGLVVVLFCLWGIKKYKEDRGTVDFFKMFLFAGISAAIFGALTNSWAGDLVSITYLPKDNFLIKLKNSLVVVDSIEQIMTLLVIILYLGLVVQMLGVFMAFLQNIKEKNYIGAIFDQVSWLIFLPCAFFFAGDFLVKGYYPPLLIKISGIGLIVSLIMVFYGGFIQSSRPVIKILKGFVNIYGIVSSYGIASILGDILSYLRLLALAIATSSMAISFNLISFLLKDIKIFGPFLVVIVLIFTNIFNLLLSILGAFIHPVRLLFFEFFGRFFQDGGTEYKPFSYQFKNIIVKGGAEE